MRNLKSQQEFTNNARQWAQEGLLLLNEAIQGNLLAEPVESVRVGVAGEPDFDCDHRRLGSLDGLRARVPDLAQMYRGFLRDRA